MTILALPAPRVQPTIDRQWIGQHEETPLEVLEAPGFPGTAEDVIALIDRPDDSPRYAIEPRRSEALGRTIFRVVDRAEDRLIAWYAVRSLAEGHAEDLNAEDHPDCGPWWETLPTSPDLDTIWNLRTTGSRAAAEWLAEGRDPVRSRATRGSDDERIDRLQFEAESFA